MKKKYNSTPEQRKKWKEKYEKSNRVLKSISKDDPKYGLRKTSAQSFPSFIYKEEISKRQYYLIMQAFFFLVIQYIVHSGMSVNMPHSLGIIRARKSKKPKVIKDSRNIIRRNTLFRNTQIRIIFSLSTYNLRNLSMLGFTPNRNLKNLAYRALDEDPSITEKYG